MSSRGAPWVRNIFFRFGLGVTEGSHTILFVNTVVLCEILRLGSVKGRSTCEKDVSAAINRSISSTTHHSVNACQIKYAANPLSERTV